MLPIPLPIPCNIFNVCHCASFGAFCYAIVEIIVGNKKDGNKKILKSCFEVGGKMFIKMFDGFKLTNIQDLPLLLVLVLLIFLLHFLLLGC